MRRAGKILFGDRRRQGAARHPVGLDLERNAKVRAAMALQSHTPQRVRTEVTHAEPDDAVATPLTHVDLLVADEVGRVLAAITHDHRRSDRDPGRTPRHGPTDPEPVAVSTLEGHDANPSSLNTRSAPYPRCHRTS